MNMERGGIYFKNDELVLDYYTTCPEKMPNDSFTADWLYRPWLVTY